jgi:hypothetical protein
MKQFTYKNQISYYALAFSVKITGKMTFFIDGYQLLPMLH